MEADYGGFSIREYTRNIRSVDVRKCWPFSGDVIQSFLPPLLVAKFRWWSHELASLLAKSPVTSNDSEQAFRRKAKSKSTPCKKRSVGEIFAAAPQIQSARREDEVDDSDVLIGSKRKKTKDLVVHKLNERSGVRCSSYTEEDVFPDSPKSVGQDLDSEFHIHGILKARGKVCSVRRPGKSDVGASQCERHVRFSNQSGKLSQLQKKIFSLELCCSQMHRLSLCSGEDQSSVNDMRTKVISNGDQTSDNMQLDSRQLNKSQPVVSERRLSHARAKSGLMCFPTPHLSLEKIKDALDLERKRHVAQPISTSTQGQYRGYSSSLSQLASSDMHRGTLLCQSPFDPLPVEWMQKSVLHRQRYVEEAISGWFPLNLQGELVEANGEGCTSFDRSLLGNGSSRSASAENDLLLTNLVDLSSGKKRSTEPALGNDMHSEKRHKYFPARLGLDETFTEKAFSISDTNDGECGQTLHSTVSEFNLRSHTMNLPKQDALSQNLSSRNMDASCDGLCLHDTQATMRLMGKDVSVGTGYSRRGERIIAPNASIDYSFIGSYTQPSWLWRTTTLGEIHSITSLDKNWNRNLLCDTSNDPFPRICEPNAGLPPQARTTVVLDSEFAPTILYPCGSLVSCPMTDKDLSLHGSGLVQQLNNVTFSEQQLTFPSTLEIAGLPSDCINVGIGLLPDAREPYIGLPYSCTDSTRQSQPHWPENSFESSRLDTSFINPAEQLASLYGP